MLLHRYMKNKILRNIILFLIPVLFIIPSCKKNDSTSQADSEFKFTYNGTQYVLSWEAGTGYAEWGIINSGIFINRPDLFNGTIKFPKSNCAYLEPQGQSVEMTGNCELSSSGFTIDSVAVYIYNSGTVDLDYTNCSSKSGYDPYTGEYYRSEICDVNGTFELTLKNKESKMITITNGSIRMYKVQVR